MSHPNWYRIDFSSALAQGKREEVTGIFDALWSQLGHPMDTGVFEEKRDLRHEIVYFSTGTMPTIGDILERYGAIACAAPKRSDVVPLIESSGGDAVPFAREA